MDFFRSQQQEELYNGILRYTKEKFHNVLKAREQVPQWSRAEWRQCGEAGLLGLCVPEHYGGSGCDALTTAHAIEAFACGCEDMGLVFSAAAHLLACVMPIVEYGNEALKEALLPGLCSGEYIGANAITERNAGSDIFALKTRAIRDGADYILTGSKSYVSNGPVADYFVIYATTNPTHGYLGISGFVVAKDTPGLMVGEAFHKMGLTSTPASQVYLEECCVPVTHRLGDEGQGSAIFKRSMQWERACLFASYIGMMDRQLERVIVYARERCQFGRPISKKQALAHRLADMKLRLEAARLLLYRACWLSDQGKDATMDISLAKLAVSEAAIQGGLDAIQIHGAVGYDCDANIERMLRDAIPGAIFSGTSEIQRDIIASELGL